MRKSNLRILIEWLLFFGAVFLAMVAVATFAGPFMAILYVLGLPVFLAQILALFLSGGFMWLLIEAYAREAG